MGEAQWRQTLFKAVFCGFVVLGCMIELSAVLDFADAMIFLIAVPNIIGLYLYAPEVKRDVADYMRRVRSGAVRTTEQYPPLQ